MISGQIWWFQVGRPVATNPFCQNLCRRNQFRGRHPLAGDARDQSQGQAEPGKEVSIPGIEGAGLSEAEVTIQDRTAVEAGAGKDSPQWVDDGADPAVCGSQQISPCSRRLACEPSASAGGEQPSCRTRHRW